MLIWHITTQTGPTYKRNRPCTKMTIQFVKCIHSYNARFYEVGQGTTVESVFLIWCIYGQLVSSSMIPAQNTKYQFWKRLCWSWKTLFRGRFFEHDFNGIEYQAGSVLGKKADTPLCGDGDEEFFGVLWIKSGDMEWYYKD